jgi:hypothetical protein
MTARFDFKALGDRVMQEGLNALSRASSAGFQSLSQDGRRIVKRAGNFLGSLDEKLRDFESSIASEADPLPEDERPKRKKKRHK